MGQSLPSSNLPAQSVPSPNPSSPNPSSPNPTSANPTNQNLPGQSAPASGTGAEAGVLVFQGQPLRVPTSCSDEQIQALGMACSAEQPCPIYLELSSMDSGNSRLLVAGNLHTETATISSVLLVSEDGGKSWREPHARIPNASLDQVQFVDLKTGFISGQMIGPLPKDPFFLLTADGGKSWTNVAVYSDSAVGSVDHFYFDSRSHGLAVIDKASKSDGGRYALYETNTGGTSWAIREVTSQKKQVKPRQAASAAWRLVAHQPSKSYRLERAEAGGKWTLVSSFLVRAGECKPAESELPEPPPQQSETEAEKQAAEAARQAAQGDAVSEFRIGGNKPAATKKENKRPKKP